jgi:hypothetical protein
MVADGFRFVDHMQTLTKVQRNAIRYFEVVPEPVGDTRHIAIPPVDGINHLAQLHDDIFGHARAGSQASEVDVNAIHEFFTNSGAITHIAGFPPEHLVSLVGLPRPDEPRLVKLRRAQILRFLSACKRVLKGSNAMRRLLVTTVAYVELFIHFGNLLMLFARGIHL